MSMQDETRAAAPETAEAEAAVPEAGPAGQKASAAGQSGAEPAAGQGGAEPAAEHGDAESAGPQPGAEAKPDAEKPASEGAEQASLLALKEQLAAAQSQAAEARDRLLRTAAEYDNFRKRSAREQDAAFNNGVSFAVGQILNILDTLEMAARAETADENYKKGVVMTLDKAAAALAALKVEEIPAEGQPFDPNLHAAVGQAPATDEAPSGQIVQVYQKGYRIGERVIRHAAVVVAE